MNYGELDNQARAGESGRPTTCRGHEWVVYSTALRNVCLLVRCDVCGTLGTIDDPSEQEWTEAFHAPSRPYSWLDGSRINSRGDGPDSGVRPSGEEADGRGQEPRASGKLPAVARSLPARNLFRCPDCGCGDGELHLKGCHIELCSVCGLQVDDCGGCKGHDRRVSAWTSVEPAVTAQLADYSPGTRRAASAPRSRSAKPAESLARYPGGKQGMIDPILARLSPMFDELGPEAEYREPFFGAGAVGMAFLRGAPGRRAWLNDADPSLATLWDGVIHRPGALKLMIEEFNHVLDGEYFYSYQRTLMSIRTPADLAGYDPNWIALAKLATQLLSFSGLGTRAGGPMGGRHQRKPHSIRSRYNPARLLRTIDAFRDILAASRLREGTCTCLPFERLFEPGGEAVFYLDPPYVEAGPGLYQIAFGEDDHFRLAEILKREDRPWLLSYDDHPVVRDLYRGWSRIEEVSMTCSINGSNTKVELLISSVPGRV